jgi:DNA gyrase subunit B
MLANNEVKSLIIALGTNIGEQFDLTGLRYHRIVIMTDADVDGAHIRTLLLTLFYRYFPQLITAGHLYIAQPPLYRVQVNKEVRYVYNDEALDKIKIEYGIQDEDLKEAVEALSEAVGDEGEFAETEISSKKGPKLNLQRYKGLGEMNPEQLWETTMDPKARMMKIVTLDDAAKADEVFDVLMGSEVAPRRRFIQTHAKTVKNLDI